MATLREFKGVFGWQLTQDEMSAARAIVLGLALDKVNIFKRRHPGLSKRTVKTILKDNDEERLAFFAAKRAFHRLWKNEKLLNEHATEMMQHVGIPLPLTQSMDVDEIEKIQLYIGPSARIHLFDYGRGPKRGEHDYSGRWPSPCNIFLIRKKIRDGCFEYALIESPNAVFPEWFCAHCCRKDNKKNQHRCRVRCNRCASLSENCKEGDRILCPDCNFVFKSRACYNRHQIIKKNGSRCITYKLCTRCDKAYNLCHGAHDCNNTRYCPRCRKKVPVDHQCTWRMPTDSELKSMRLKQTNWRWLVFDTETCQTIRGRDGRLRYNARHFVNVVVIYLICNKCVLLFRDDPCVDCGDERLMAWYYRSPDEDPNKVMDDFAQFLLHDRRAADRICLAHNGSKFDFFFLHAALLRNGVAPKPVMKGLQLITARIKKTPEHNGFIIRDSYRLIPIPLSQFEAAFNLEGCGKGWFPYLKNDPSNYGSVWHGLPAKKYYSRKHMKEGAAREFDLWYDAQPKDAVYQQDVEILKYTIQDVYILVEGLVTYRTEMMAMTGWDPVCLVNTIASFVQLLFRTKFIADGTMYYISEAGFGGINQSEIALKWFRWLEFTQGITLQHKNRGGEKMIRIDGKRIHLDAFDRDTRIAYELHGCLFHGCPVCFDEDSTNRFTGESQQHVYEHTLRREALIRRHPDISSLVVIWECELKQQLKSDPAMKQFFKEEEVVSRIRPRECLSGGRVEAFSTIVEAKEGYTIHYKDVISMYPSIMATVPLPCGAPRVITEDFRPPVDGVFAYMGIAKIRILPPQDLKKPVLGMKCRQSLIFGLCRRCMELDQDICDHTDPLQRALLGVYTHWEINLALSLSYTILDIYEIWEYDEWRDDFYLEYVNTFLESKIRASGWPMPVEQMTRAEKFRYLSEFHKDGIFLEEKDIVVNPVRKFLSKLGMNVGWGKLCQSPLMTTFEYGNTLRLFKVMSDPSREMKTYSKIDDDLWAIRHAPLAETVHSSDYSNIIHSAYICSASRIKLYGYIQAVGDGVHYVDTDSLIYTAKDNEDPLEDEVGISLGRLSSEVPFGKKIKKVVIIAPKFYGVLMDDDTEVVKNKGVTLDLAAQELVHCHSMENILRDKIAGKDTVIVTSRPHLKRKWSFDIQSVKLAKRCKVTDRKCVLLDDGTRVPYGLAR